MVHIANQNRVLVAPRSGVRGLKSIWLWIVITSRFRRTPLMGAWIEMIVTTVVDAIKSSHPAQGCVD